MESKATAGKAMRQSIRDNGIPELLTSDGAAEQTGPGPEFVKNFCHQKVEIVNYVIIC
jgi:hypothetical protein